MRLGLLTMVRNETFTADDVGRKVDLEAVAKTHENSRMLVVLSQ